MNHFKIALYGLFLSLIGPNIVLAADQLYPTGSSNSVDYSISPANPNEGESFVITRIIIDGESYSLSSIYLSDNLPPQFSLDSVTIRINGSDQTIQQEGPISDQVLSGYQSYRWIIGDLSAGDTLVVQEFLVCDISADYTLPLHSSIMYGNGSPFFATSDPVAISIAPAADNSPPAQIVDLQEVP